MAVKTCALVALFGFLLLLQIYKSDGAEICEDTVLNCGDFNASICQSSRLWAENNCAKFCGLCTNELDTNGCHDGWSYFEADRTCLKVFGRNGRDQRQIWPNARKHCQRLGGDLVVIKNKEKNSFVLDLLLIDNDYAFAWIGLMNIAKNGFKFQYVDGSDLNSYHPWLPFAPDNNLSREKCVYLWITGANSGQWNDFYCLGRLLYVCSIPSENVGVDF